MRSKGATASPTQGLHHPSDKEVLVERKKHEIWAVFFLMVTLLIFFSLISFHANDPTFFNSVRIGPRNWVGSVGANVSYCLLLRLGLGAYALPLIGLWVSWCLFGGRSPFTYRRIQPLGIALLLFCTTALAAMYQPQIHFLNQEIPAGAGGEFGVLLSEVLVERFYATGAHIILIGTLVIGFLLATPFSLKAIIEKMSKHSLSGFRGILSLVSAFFSRLGRRVLHDADKMQEQPGTSIVGQAPPISEKTPGVELLPPPPPTQTKRKTRKELTAAEAASNRPEHYALPSLEILDHLELDDYRPDWKKLEENARVLEEKLADFGVQGKVVAISPGPVITMYEYAPAPGIKISRIVSLSDDLSMALKAISIRVVAPIPGKAAIGIELPNQRRDVVIISAILESEAFSSASAPLTIALGKDTTGQPVVANLARMPHLLIAGATGTGKSVCLNTVLTSLLFRNTPEDMRLLLIDPKRIELKSYENIPHLIHPVVNDAKMATRALRWAVQEMELRYRMLAEKNVRNIESYNRALAREKPREDKKEDAIAGAIAGDPGIKHRRLPYMVIIIDELADLMMVASREVEESITRLAQMARAAGIHLILATQRPSVDVLTGIIKANIPTRLSFQVSSRIDSRTVIDASGAESLLGSGDMLFLPPGTGKLQRIHGAFISEAEVQRTTDFWRAQSLVEDTMSERVSFHDQSSTDEIAEDEFDEKYEEAIELVLETRQASISMLQRRLRVGYNRAARMIEMMEQQGIVGASDGVKPREVLGKKNS
jgi:DNA segregation ATPase FtsK/SpoIIIE, S-DNA-T family